MALTTHILTKAISRQIYQPAFRVAADKEHWSWKTVASVKQSKAAYEQGFNFTGLGAAVATGELEPAYYSNFQENSTTTWTHTKYTLGSMVSQEMIEDNQNLPDIMSSLGTMIGEGMSYIVDYTVAQIFNRAMNSSYTGYDSTEMCGTHTLQKEGVTTVTNLGSAASITFDTLWSGINYFEYSMYTHEALPLTDTAKYLLFHPSQLKTVRKVLETQGEPDTADNNKNTLLKYGIIPIPCRFLTSTYWFLLGSKFKEHLKFFWRIQKETKEDTDFDRDAMKLKSRMRFSVNWDEWMYVWGNAGA